MKTGWSESKLLISLFCELSRHFLVHIDNSGGFPCVYAQLM